MTNLETNLHNDLVKTIVTAREFCATEASENETIRDWAADEGVVLTRGQVRKAKEEATETYKSASAVNHYYFG